MSKKRFLTSDKLMSMTAVLVSVCTLLVFLYQTNMIKKQQHMSVFPYLTLGDVGITSSRYKLLLENEGIGPAIITSINIIDENGVNYDDVVDLVRANLTPKDSVSYYYANLSVGRLIPQQGYIEVIVVNDGKETSSNKVYTLLNASTIELEYESVYGERWVSTNKKIAPVKK